MKRGAWALAGFARVRRAVGSRALKTAFSVVFALGALATVLPIFSARYLPIQDLPQHVAAVRVLFDYTTSGLGFEAFYERSLSSTQYLSVYLVAGVLASVVGPLHGIKLVLAGALIALPYSIRAVLVELRKPPSYALLALPLAYNPHLILGFVNFIAALPLLFFGIALAIRLSRGWTRGRATLLGGVALLCFYTHVVPYGMLVLATAAVSIGRDAPRLFLGMSALAPSALASFIWLFTNPAGTALAQLLTSPAGAPQFAFLSTTEALNELWRWVTDVFHDPNDERVFVLWLLLVITIFSVGSATLARTAPALASLRRRVAWGLPVAVLGYWLLPASYGFVWPIHARFTLIALLFAILALPRLGRAGRTCVAAVALVLTVWSGTTAWHAFRGAWQHEYVHLDPVLQRIPEGSRVAGLIYDTKSRFVRFSPYLHAVAWAQVERGGAVRFSFAEFPHSPFRLRAENRPPPVPPRWEWNPQRVDAARDLAWFDYVLTRGAPPQDPDPFQLVHREGPWALWHHLVDPQHPEARTRRESARDAEIEPHVEE